MLSAASHNEVLVAFVADGAGSSSFGGAAAELACVTAFELVSAWVNQRQGDTSPSTEDLRSWLESVQAVVASAAQAKGDPLREWACTLLGAVCSATFSAFMQIGDGVIVVRRNGGLSPVFWPQSGEYANETTFLISHGAIESSCVAISEPVDAVALMTDGLQALALDYQARSAHEPFFRPLLTTLIAEVDGHAFELKLQAFLASKLVNQRTNDDKTLVLAVRV